MLYILIKQDKTAFKVGITKRDDLIRIKDLNRIYTFNLAESYLVKGIDDSVTKHFERQLLSDYKVFQFNIEGGLDGGTEFIAIDKLQDILQEVEFKSRLTHLGLTIVKGIEFKKLEDKPKSEKPKRMLTVQPREEKFHRDTYIYETIAAIINSKNIFSYYEEETKEGVTGYLVSKDRYILQQFQKTNSSRFISEGNGIFSVTNIANYFQANYFDCLLAKSILVEEQPVFVGCQYLQTRLVRRNIRGKFKNLEKWVAEVEEYYKEIYDPMFLEKAYNDWFGLGNDKYVELPFFLKNVRSRLNTQENGFVRYDNLVNARMAYFQKICRRELVPTPEELRIW